MRIKKIEGQMSESMLMGALLAMVGGFLDAYTYLLRGHVFAFAQTGNIVLLGIRLADGAFRQACYYLIPIAAFAVGVLAVEIIRRRFYEHSRIHWRQIILAAECLTLLGLSFVPLGRWDIAVNPIVSFLCAMQVQAFRKIKGDPFASTMCTGNLRSGTEQLVIWRQTGDRGAAKKMRNYYAIILFFILGAVLGSFATGWLGERALLLTCAPLLAVFGIMFIAEEREGRETRGSLEN